MFTNIDRLGYQLGWSLTIALIVGSSGILPAQAATRRFSHQLTGGASFESMVRQAEAIAQETAYQAFGDPATTEVVVNIAGEQAGQIAPILFLNVTRENWQRQQSIQQWAKYPGGAKRLLGFERPNLIPQTATIATASNPIRDGMTEREANFYK
jgi:hypothetical protein